MIHNSTIISNDIKTTELAIISNSEEATPIQLDNVSGLVTSTDAVEEITGDLEDPLE